MFSTIRRFFGSSSPAKLRRAQQNAERALERLSNDPETAKEAEILRARYEELKERHERLLEKQETSDGDEKVEPEVEEEEELVKCKVVTEEDGTVTCTLMSSSQDAESISLEFKITPPAEGEDPVQAILDAAEELVAKAMETIDEHSAILDNVQILHLANMFERLQAEQKKVEASPSSTTVSDIAARLYFSDALRYLRTVQLMVILQKQEGREKTVE
ncbi:hypothetical protein Hypma_007480 [Hypsizygus marmoreus]|uniref:Uncharacterized protein n=1 Tax=Hypsizygus marmoreus TaxID=39966 RepID=A0A369JTE1_HYPMA|nr:hypothetical protein Hypma_007480 [Hypsizygus marmoreus]